MRRAAITAFGLGVAVDAPLATPVEPKRHQ